MKIITHEDILNAGIAPLTCFDWVSEAIAHKNNAMLPPKVSLKPREGVFYNTMPVLMPEYKCWGGVKVVNRYPERTPSLGSQILLYDLETGECLALIDANWITAMRTGAVAAHSMKLFAKQSFSTLGFIGLGNVARATLDIFLALYPDREMTIKLLKYKDQHELFANRFKKYRNVRFQYVDTYSETIIDSDIVVEAATYLGDDICSIDAIKTGSLVVPVHTRGFTQFDYQFDRIFADDIGHVKGFRNFDKYKNIAEVTDVVNGRTFARENDEEKIIVYNIGIALHDIYYAGKIYGVIGNGCKTVDLNSPKEKFWI